MRRLEGKEPSLPISMILRHSQCWLAGVFECLKAWVRRKYLRVRLDFDQSEDVGGQTEEQMSVSTDMRVYATHVDLSPEVLTVALVEYVDTQMHDVKMASKFEGDRPSCIDF